MDKALTKVLAILKEPEMGELLRLILSRQGATVRTEPLDIGLACIESAVMSAQKDPPDLVVLDSELLSDEQYYQLKTSQVLQDVPILFMDAKPHNLVDKQVRRLGVNGYVLTPFDPQEFLAAFRAVLRGENYYPPLPETSPSGILHQRTQAVSEDLLRILRCPYCVTGRAHRTSEDVGRLELIQGCWLVCRESECGRKYPVRDGIPAMLVEEGDKWINVAEENLPVPPPPE